MTYLVACLAVLLVVALSSYVASRGAARRGGLPAGQVLYSDTGSPVGRIGSIVKDARGVRQEKPLVSKRYGLTGRPDYLVRTREGVVPVEIKSARCPAGGRAYDSHVMQLAAYCLLVEDVLGATVPYGVIQ
ncbi:MAG TPA: PD-(D/E)XK nuclease family protein, partial [Pyrinomonadaceae bacterium]